MVKTPDISSSPTNRSIAKPPSKPLEREFPKLTLNGITYFVGDCVRVREYDDDNSFARIMKIFTRSNEAFLLIRWFYKPSDIYTKIPEYIADGELFDSDLENEIYAVSVYDKIKIMSIDQYEELDEVDNNMFFCRAKFFTNTGEISPPVDEWPKICSCNNPFNPEKENFRCDKCNKIFHPICVGEQYKDLCPNCFEGADIEWEI